MTMQIEQFFLLLSLCCSHYRIPKFFQDGFYWLHNLLYLYVPNLLDHHYCSKFRNRHTTSDYNKHGKRTRFYNSSVALYIRHNLLSSLIQPNVFPANLELKSDLEFDPRTMRKREEKIPGRLFFSLHVHFDSTTAKHKAYTTQLYIYLNSKQISELQVQDKCTIIISSFEGIDARQQLRALCTTLRHIWP